MAGIGVRLNRIYEKNTLTSNLVGIGYSVVITVAPMIFVILAIFCMQIVLDVSKCGYAARELFACTVLYIFIFSMLMASPFNSVFSRYMSDIIFEERYEDIMPCFYVGMLMNTGFGALFGIPFCVREYLVSNVSGLYVFTSYCGYLALILVFYAMLYLSICKDYPKISFFFAVGMILTVILSAVFVYVFHMEKTYAMLLALTIGFLLIACLETALIRSYFRENSGRYRLIFHYFVRFWKLVLTNFLYTLGLYIHNFVFWTTNLRMVVAKSFVCVTSYDMATCLAMFTNISASMIFISRVEMHFHERYKLYSEAVIGGRNMDIQLTKNRMFRQMGEELSSLVRIQFFVSIIVYFICVILLPAFGFGGLVLKIYPCLAAGYFVLFIMYATVIFLYYFNDLTGSLITAGSFCLITLLMSILATHLPELWYGIGVLSGSIISWSIAYFRIKWLEQNLDEHTFCRGSMLQAGKGKKPSAKVFDRYAKDEVS